MDFFKKNFDKIALIIGALVVAASLFFTSEHSQKMKNLLKSTSTNGNLKLPNCKSIIQSSTIINRPDNFFRYGKPVNRNGRSYQLFENVDFYIKKNNPSVLIDILDPSTPAIHSPVPNNWLLKHNLPIEKRTVLKEDTDQDGFTNLEEFNSKTNPTTANSYPPLISKLICVDVQKSSYTLYLLHANDISAHLKLRDFKANIRAEATVKRGETFFSKGPYKNRFKLVNIEKFTPTNGSYAGIETTRAIVLDLYAIKSKAKKVIYYTDFKKQLFSDYTVELRLNALQDRSSTLSVGEGQSFNLPLTNKNKPFRYRVTAIKPISKERANIDVLDTKNNKIFTIKYQKEEEEEEE